MKYKIHLRLLTHVYSCILAVTSTLYFDEEKDRSGMERNKMLITFNYMLTLMEMKVEMRDKIMSHEKPVISALYNSVYNQVRVVSHEKPVNFFLSALYNSVYNQVHVASFVIFV